MFGDATSETLRNLRDLRLRQCWWAIWDWSEELVSYFVLHNVRLCADWVACLAASTAVHWTTLALVLSGEASSIHCSGLKWGRSDTSIDEILPRLDYLLELLLWMRRYFRDCLIVCLVIWISKRVLSLLFEWFNHFLLWLSWPTFGLTLSCSLLAHTLQQISMRLHFEAIFTDQNVLHRVWIVDVV